MSLHFEDRELQIRLAELQADIQINLAACFGIIAIFAALMIGQMQAYFSLPPEDTAIRTSLIISIVMSAIVAGAIGNYFMGKVVAARKQMKELRKKYVW